MTTDELKDDPKLLSDEELQARFDYMDEIRQTVFLGGESTLLSICDSLTRHIAALREPVLPWRGPEEPIRDEPALAAAENAGSRILVAFNREELLRSLLRDGEYRLLGVLYNSDILAALPETGGGK
jgi:hypothetical protein